MNDGCGAALSVSGAWPKETFPAALHLCEDAGVYVPARVRKIHVSGLFFVFRVDDQAYAGLRCFYVAVQAATFCRRAQGSAPPASAPRQRQAGSRMRLLLLPLLQAAAQDYRFTITPLLRFLPMFVSRVVRLRS